MIKFDPDTKLSLLDIIFMEQNPGGDPNFDPEHNRRVIEGTIKKNNLLRRKKIRDHEQEVRERASAVASFVKAVEKGGKTTKVESYFGKKHLAYLRGEEILDEMRRYAKNGKLVKKGS